MNDKESCFSNLQRYFFMLINLQKDKNKEFIMKKYYIALALCFLSFFSHAMDMKEGNYIPNPRIKRFVEKDSLNAFTYQLLRHSQNLLEDDRANKRKKQFHTQAIDIW